MKRKFSFTLLLLSFCPYSTQGPPHAYLFPVYVYFVYDRSNNLDVINKFFLNVPYILYYKHFFQI